MREGIVSRHEAGMWLVSPQNGMWELSMERCASKWDVGAKHGKMRLKVDAIIAVGLFLHGVRNGTGKESGRQMNGVFDSLAA